MGRSLGHAQVVAAVEGRARRAVCTSLPHAVLAAGGEHVARAVDVARAGSPRRPPTTPALGRPRWNHGVVTRDGGGHAPRRRRGRPGSSARRALELGVGLAPEGGSPRGRARGRSRPRSGPRKPPPPVTRTRMGRDPSKAPGGGGVVEMEEASDAIHRGVPGVRGFGSRRSHARHQDARCPGHRGLHRLRSDRGGEARSRRPAAWPALRVLRCRVGRHGRGRGRGQGPWRRGLRVRAQRGDLDRTAEAHRQRRDDGRFLRPRPWLFRAIRSWSEPRETTTRAEPMRVRFTCSCATGRRGANKQRLVASDASAIDNFGGIRRRSPATRPWSGPDQTRRTQAGLGLRVRAERSGLDRRNRSSSPVTRGSLDRFGTPSISSAKPSWSGLRSTTIRARRRCGLGLRVRAHSARLGRNSRSSLPATRQAFD